MIHGEGWPRISAERRELGAAAGAGATLTVKYPTTADCVPDGGDDGSGVTRVERVELAAQARGQRRHGGPRGHSRGRSAQDCALHAARSKYSAGEPGAAVATNKPPLFADR